MRIRFSASTVPLVVKRAVLGVFFAVVVIVLLLWLAGRFEPKVSPIPSVDSVTVGMPIGQAALVEVRSIRVPTTESAVGSVKSVHKVSVAAKILARVQAINIQAGQRVGKGDVLIRLDDADLKARHQQAQAGVNASTAAVNQARIEHDRIKKLFDGGNASLIEFDRVSTALKSAEAELQRAQQAEQEAAVMLEYATVRSPIDGVVIDKRIELGDMATPGRVLVTLFDPTRMQFVASVRESLTHRLAVGQDIDVRIDAIAKTCQGQISEIVPEAQEASRSFLAKVTGPCPPGVYPGMFGRVLIPLDDEDILVVPKAAVRRVGQLDMVDVVQESALARRVVQLGRDLGDDVQVLTGLRAGDRVALQPKAPANE
jgi:RND family efflux transporter MFP subunit